VTTALALLARARAAGLRVTLLPGRRINVRPTPPPDLLAELRAARGAIIDVLAAEAALTPRPSRPGALPGDPSPPVVEPEATRTLIVLELAGAEPGLRSDGQLGLAHPERVSPKERATALQHKADIVALLSYRALLEQRWPVAREPNRREDPPCR
jgi:hypothetical protein